MESKCSKEMAKQLCNLSYKGRADKLMSRASRTNVNCRHRGFTPLMQAALSPHNRGVECARVLLLLGADASSCDAVGKTAAHYAAFRDNRAVMNVLFAKAEAVLQAKTAIGETPLMWAASMNNVHTVVLLLQLGTDPHTKNKNDKTALDLAAEFGAFSCHHLLAFAMHGQAVTHDQLRRDFLVEERGKALGQMAQNGDLKMLQKYTTKSLCNYRWQSRTPLMWAAGSSADTAKDCASLLLSLGADPTLTDWQGWTATHRAAKTGNVELLKLLPSSCVNIKDSFGETPLMLAAYFGQLEAASVLLQQGANVNDCDRVGGTAITKASSSEIKELLMGKTKT